MSSSLAAMHNRLIDLAAIADLCYDNQTAAKTLRDAAMLLARGMNKQAANG
jgi:hypothetical protein